MIDKKQEVLNGVIEIISHSLDIKKDKIIPKSNLANDLGADSLDSVEIVMEIEEKYDISCPDEDITSIKTVNDLVEYILKKI